MARVGLLVLLAGVPSPSSALTNGKAPAIVHCRATDDAQADDPAAASVRAALTDVDPSTGLLRRWPVRDDDRAAVVILAESDVSVHAVELVEHYVEEGFDRVFFLANDAFDEQGTWLREALSGVDPRMWEVTPLHEACNRPGGGRFSLHDDRDTPTLSTSGDELDWHDWHAAQEHAITCVLRRLQAEGGWGWLAQMDSDEYLHSRACPGRSVVSLLRNELSYCDAVYAPWLFYSFGEQQAEPCGRVREALEWRWQAFSKGAPDREGKRTISAVKFDASGDYAKYVTRVNSTLRLQVHTPIFRKRQDLGREVTRCAACVRLLTPKNAGHWAPRTFLDGGKMTTIKTKERKSLQSRTSANGNDSFVFVVSGHGKNRLLNVVKFEAQVPALTLAVAHYRVTSWVRWRAKRSNEFPLASRYFMQNRGVGASLKRVSNESQDVARANRLDVRDSFMREQRAAFAAKRRPPMAVHSAAGLATPLVVSAAEAQDAVAGMRLPPVGCAAAFGGAQVTHATRQNALGPPGMLSSVEARGSLLRLVVAWTGAGGDGTAAAVASVLCARGVKTIGVGVRCHVSNSTHAVHDALLRSWANLVRAATTKQRRSEVQRIASHVVMGLVALTRSGVHALVGAPYGQLLLELAWFAPRAVLVHVAQQPERWAAQQPPPPPAGANITATSAAAIVVTAEHCPEAARARLPPLSPLACLTESEITEKTFTTLQQRAAGDVATAAREYAAHNAAIRAALLAGRPPRPNELSSGSYVAACAADNSESRGTAPRPTATASLDGKETEQANDPPRLGWAGTLDAIASAVAAPSFMCDRAR